MASPLASFTLAADITFLYDRQRQRLLPTPGLNAKQEDFDPCVIVLKAGE